MADLWVAAITTLGTLVGSFGGFVLASRAQRIAEDRKDEREREKAALDRVTALEDERHKRQLETLLSLQELTRAKARATYLIIEQDRRSLIEDGSYSLLPADIDASEFENSIAFAQTVAQVTDEPLRKALEEFSVFCERATTPPSNPDRLTREQGIDLQVKRDAELFQRVNETSETLGKHLRTELDRSRSAEPSSY